MVTICFLQRKWKIRYLKELSNNMIANHEAVCPVLPTNFGSSGMPAHSRRCLAIP